VCLDEPGGPAPVSKPEVETSHASLPTRKPRETRSAFGTCKATGFGFGMRAESAGQIIVPRCYVKPIRNAGIAAACRAEKLTSSLCDARKTFSGYSRSLALVAPRALDVAAIGSQLPAFPRRAAADRGSRLALPALKWRDDIALSPAG